VFYLGPFILAACA